MIESMVMMIMFHLNEMYSLHCTDTLCMWDYFFSLYFWSAVVCCRHACLKGILFFFIVCFFLFWSFGMFFGFVINFHWCLCVCQLNPIFYGMGWFMSANVLFGHNWIIDFKWNFLKNCGTKFIESFSHPKSKCTWQALIYL